MSVETVERKITDFLDDNDLGYSVVPSRGIIASRYSDNNDITYDLILVYSENDISVRVRATGVQAVCGCDGEVIKLANSFNTILKAGHFYMDIQDKSLCYSNYSDFTGMDVNNTENIENTILYAMATMDNYIKCFLPICAGLCKADAAFMKAVKER